MTSEVQIRVGTTLDDEAHAEVVGLLDRAGRTDAAPALNEAGRLALQRSRPGVTHLGALREQTLVGYAQLEDGPAGSTGQVVVDPAARRTGVGTALVAALRTRATSPLQVWAIGNTPAAAALARRSGLLPVRTLLVMTRSLADLPEAVLPPGVRIDTFDPAVDGPAWLAVNRRAFAAHPEQGAITADDLADRLREPWFDPDGFFLARSTEHPGAGLLGFHWTKQHGGGLGEVYVLGVDPEAEGRGLAKALLLHGLSHLRTRGNDTVELYVEADSARAVGLYQSRGFSVASRDVMYGDPASVER